MQILPEKPEPSSTPPPLPSVKEEEEISTDEYTKKTGAATDDLSSSAAAAAAVIDDTTASIGEIEISANLSHINLSVDDASELDELEMMIQSAGPFQHPSRSNQNYGHGANTFRQSYHHHHHQVSFFFLFLTTFQKFLKMLKKEIKFLIKSSVKITFLS